MRDGGEKMTNTINFMVGGEAGQGAGAGRQEA